MKVWMVTLYLMSNGHWKNLEQVQVAASTCRFFQANISAHDIRMAVACIPEAKP